MKRDLGIIGRTAWKYPVVRSLNIDRLAARGMRFDNAYCQFPFCGPSRASLLTGLHPDASRVVTNSDATFRERHSAAVTLPQMFKNNGWRSMRLAKMFHMAMPVGVGTIRRQVPPSWNVSVSPPGDEHNSVGLGGNPNPELRHELKMQWARLSTLRVRPTVRPPTRP